MSDPSGIPDAAGESGAGADAPPRRARRARTMRETLGSIVLGFELIIVFLGALVLFGLKSLPAPVALGGERPSSS